MQAGILRAGIAACFPISWRRGVACLILAHFALLLWLGLTRHWGLLTSLNLLTVQEHIGPLVAGLGLLWGLRNSSWRVGLFFALLGIGHTLVVLGIIMPALSPTHSHPMFNAGLGQLSRYGWMGASLGEIAAYPFFHPGDFLKTVLIDFGGAAYLIGLLFSVFLLPLAGITFLLPGIADLAAVISVCLGYALAPLPLPGAANLWAAKHYPWTPEPALADVRSVISGNDSLSVQANVGAYFSQRKAIYQFPAGLGKADAIVLHLGNPTWKSGPVEADEVALPAHHLQMNTEAYLGTIEALLEDADYGVLLWKNSWVVLGRGYPAAHPAVRAEIRERLIGLRKEWLPVDAG